MQTRRVITSETKETTRLKGDDNQAYKSTFGLV